MNVVSCMPLQQPRNALLRYMAAISCRTWQHAHEQELTLAIRQELLMLGAGTEHAFQLQLAQLARFDYASRQAVPQRVAGLWQTYCTARAKALSSRRKSAGNTHRNKA